MRLGIDSTLVLKCINARVAAALALLAITGAWEETKAQDDEERLFWETVRCHEEMEVRAYLEEFPSGAYVDEAEQCLDKRAKQRANTNGRAWLGVLMQSVTRDLAESFGMSKPVGTLIAELVPGSPAAESDLQPGDVIVEYDGKRLTEMSDLPPMVAATAVGETVELGIIRNGEEMTVELELGELPTEGARVAGPDGTRETVLGMRLENLDTEAKRELEMDHGVRVQEVLDDGPAREADIQSGDVLLQIAGEDVKDVDQVRDLASGLPAGKSVPVLVKRELRSVFLALKVPKRT